MVAWKLFLNPDTWLKLVATGGALITNGVQLSEMSDARGLPLPGYELEYHALAQLVAREGFFLRRHVGMVNDGDT